jgi:formamidopyrimidine-DNA glycosylase
MIQRVPELPEIEVLKRSLEPHITDLAIERTVVRERRLRERVDVGFARRLSGRRIERVRRRAKYLLIDLSGPNTLVVHLGMSGSLLLGPGDAPVEPHEHVSIFLDSGQRLRFRDPRRFGLMLTLPTAALASDKRFRNLGIEPLEGELSGRRYQELAGSRRGPVKTFLMNGALVVGVGNIYASEALFQAGIHPRRSVARISEARWERLSQTIQSVLGAAIEQGGTTLNDFLDGGGNEGYFQVALDVYGREGEPCHRCDGTIRRIVQTGRSTFYCPRCQR